MRTNASAGKRTKSLGMTALSLCAAALACVHPAAQAEVQVTNDAGHLLDVKLVDATVLSGIAWGQSELQAGVPATPLDDARVLYRADSQRTELDVFDVDPAERRAALQDADWYAGVIAQPNLWFDRAGTFGTPLALAPALVIPYPTDDVLFGFPDAFAERALNRPEFFAGAQPSGAAGDPFGQGSVKALRIYDHGACSFDQPLASVFAIAQGDVARALAALPCISSQYTRLVSYLDHMPGAPFDLRGGFFFSGHFHATLQDPAPDVDVFANYNYRFRLTDPNATLTDGTAIGRGIVTVRPGQNYLRVDAPTAFGLDFSAFTHTIATNTFDTTVPDMLTASSYAQQTRNVLGSQVPTCDPTSVSPCVAAQLALAVAITRGASEMGLSESEADHLATLANATNPPNWRCVAVTNPGQPAVHQCHYVLRAKRINVYPDALELVWFDEDKELDNPAYAVWVAAHAPAAGEGAVRQLCAHVSAIKPFFRPFVSLSAGPRGAGSSCGCSYAGGAPGGAAVGAFAIALAAGIGAWIRRRRAPARALGLVAMLYASACRASVESSPAGGAGGTGGLGTGGTTSGGAGGGVWTDCSSPSGYEVCGGDYQCPACPQGCLSVAGPTISPCINAEFIAFGVKPCFLCPDGDACVTAGEGGIAFICAPFELAQLYAHGGHTAMASYVDHGLFTGAALPEPATCPTFATFRICGGACGGCPVGETCTGRSPLHPYGQCVRNDVGSCSVGGGPCQAGYGCFSYLVEPEGQAAADYANYCIEQARCLDMAANYPGGGKCVL